MLNMLNWQAEGLALAQSLLNQKRYTQALSLAQKLLVRVDESSEDKVAVLRLAMVAALELGEYKQARRYAKAAIQMEPLTSAFWFTLGEAYAEDRMGSFSKAAKAFHKAHQCDATNDMALANFGLNAVKANRVNAGLKALKTAYTRANGNNEVLEVVVEGLIAAGRAGLAVKWLERLRFRLDMTNSLTALLTTARFAAASMPNTNTVGRSVIPFVRVAHETTSEAREGVVRMDNGSTPRRPHVLALRVRR